MKYILIILLAMSKDSKCQNRETDTVKCQMLLSKSSGMAYSYTGFALREKHNTAEGVNDSGFNRCVDQDGNLKSCYEDFWVVVKYLTIGKKELPKDIIVWQAKIE